jgi:hypothetical protein
MADAAGQEPSRDPQDLERLLVSRERAGDVEGMVALYEPLAILDADEGRLLQGRDAIRAYFAELWPRAEHSRSASSARPSSMATWP